MNVKSDRRVKMTKLLLEKSLLDIVEKKTFATISISEICKEADVSRNTFYNHYNTTYDLLSEIEDRYYNEMIENIYSAEGGKNQLAALCTCMKDNARISRLVFLDDNSKLFKKLIEYTKTIFMDQFTIKITTKNKQFFEKSHLFWVQGLTALFNDWIANDFKESVEEFSEMLHFFSNNTIDKVKQKLAASDGGEFNYTT
ncbi:MAG: TetR/AcrR family transcriptional regulator [Bacteroidales bacterium]|nr:TetR/AcrR family transcriptional regulator [Bacteroidales bacterium]